MGVSLQQYRVTIGAHAGSLWKKTPATRSRSKTTYRKSRKCNRIAPWQIMLLLTVKWIVNLTVLLGLLTLITPQLGLEVQGGEMICDTILVPKGQWLTDVNPLVKSEMAYTTTANPFLLAILLIRAGIEINPGPDDSLILKFIRTAVAGDLATVRRLLSLHPSLATSKLRGFSVLHYAVGQSTIVKELLQNGADMKELSPEGITHPS